MKNIDSTIIDFLSHYANALNATGIKSILDKSAVETDEEASELLDFLEEMCAQVKTDAGEEVIVLRQPVTTYDAEKVCSVVEDYLENAGFGHLLDEA